MKSTPATNVRFVKQFQAVPNILTLLRLFIIPFLVIAITDGKFGVAFSLFLLAGLSDGLDGLLARWLGQHTRLGQYLDPIADKLMLSTLFVTLTHVGLIPRYVTVLVFSRDLGILLIATLLFATGMLRDFGPSLLGKLNTVVQILALIAILCERVFAATATSTGWIVARDGVLRAVAVLAPLSAAQYAWIVIRRVHAPETAG